MMERVKRLFAGYLRRIAAAFLAAVLAAALTGQAVLAADLQPKSEQPKGEQLLLAVGEGEFCRARP